ncbi:MAG: hypothetical protein RLY31_2466 [Bacteroidota bacterium]|jgi:bacillithiol biosynthesis cysteine-adding enzyme BshC
MQTTKLEYDQVPLLSARDLAYIREVPALRPFYQYPVTLAAFRSAMEDKAKDSTDRETLVRVLSRQYQGLPETAEVTRNIERLRDAGTFTVVTAHQPSLLTGPLYYIYKIVSAINLARQLNEAYPDRYVVPVFVNSGEDHDFAEVNHLHLYNRSVFWENGGETGAVAMMRTDSLGEVLATLDSLLGDSPSARQLMDMLHAIYRPGRAYGDAAFELVHSLFGHTGLVVLNTGDPELKRRFIPAIREEILNQPSVRLVHATIDRLTIAGFPSQATPRDINFFYLKEQLRERIVSDGDGFTVLHTDIRFSRDEMEAEIERHPERFSPNVVMRPIFQEWILPNLAYVGGGGELAYWLERKDQFEHFGVNFPVLVRRNSALWVDAPSAKRLGKLGLSLSDLWDDTDTLVRRYLARSQDSPTFELEQERNALEPVFSAIAGKASAVDSTLVKSVWAEHARLMKSLEQLETKLLRAEKQKNDVALQQVRQLKEKLFPGNGLQERHDNFLPLYLRHGRCFFDSLLQAFDPLEKKFVVLAEE